MFRTYTELSSIRDFSDRFKYLKLAGLIGESTFGFDRFLNQTFYRSPEWKEARRIVIARDLGLDLGCDDHPIGGHILVHHMNPIVEDDILEHKNHIIDPEYLISVSFDTHNAIHFGDENLLHKYDIVERFENDTCPWRNVT